MSTKRNCGFLFMKRIMIKYLKCQHPWFQAFFFLEKTENHDDLFHSLEENSIRVIIHTHTHISESWNLKFENLTEITWPIQVLFLEMSKLCVCVWISNFHSRFRKWYFLSIRIGANKLWNATLHNVMVILRGDWKDEWLSENVALLKS